jgi:anaerobic glycerol-3-phosphate dehydrogenase
LNPIETDVLVIGSGAAGIAAAKAARNNGARVTVVSVGAGASALTNGTVWGHAKEPFAQWFEGRGMRMGGRYITTSGWMITHARGALASLLDLSTLQGTIAVVDLDTHPSWSAKLIASTLGARIVRPASAPSEETFREMAGRLDANGIAEGIAAELRRQCEGVSGVLFPPVLGLKRNDVAERMTQIVGVPVGECAGAAGDPPGVRLERALRSLLPDDVTIVRQRATVSPQGSSGATLADGNKVHAKAVVLATGNLAGGGLLFDHNLREATAGAAIWTYKNQRISLHAGAERGADPSQWFADGSPRGVGVRTNRDGNILEEDGVSVLSSWLFAAGDITTSVDGTGLTDSLAAGAHAGTTAALFARGS